MGNAECGVEMQGRSHPEASADIPHSALRIPHLLAGALLLALVSPPAGAQQPDSIRIATLPPVLVPAVRLPPVRELPPGLPGRPDSPATQILTAPGVPRLPTPLSH